MAHRIVSLHAGYDGPNGFVDGYVGRPADGAQHPGLVVVSGMGGLNWFQREMTRTFARAGFVALSPDLFDGALPEGRATQLRYKNSLDVGRTVENLSAGADFLRSLPWTPDDGPVGIVGFCLGGGPRPAVAGANEHVRRRGGLLPQPLPRFRGAREHPSADDVPLRNARPHDACLGDRGVPGRRSTGTRSNTSCSCTRVSDTRS